MTKVDGMGRDARHPRAVRPGAAYRRQSVRKFGHAASAGAVRPAGECTNALNALCLLAACATMAAAPAHAYLVGTGFAALYDGLTQLWLTPADLLVVVALALLAGQRGTRTSRWTLLAFPIAWLASGVAAAQFPTESILPVVITLAFACAGLLVVVDTRLRPAAVSTFTISAGLLHGYANGGTMAWGETSVLGLAGVATAIVSLFAILSAQVVALRTEWLRAAVRVAGRRIAAIGALTLGWLAHSLI